MGRIYQRRHIVQPAFTPASVSAVSGWLRLQASAQSGGKWTNWVDMLNSNPAVQADADRQPTVAAAANGLPIATYDGTSDCGPAWPLNATNNGTEYLGFMLWVRPTDVGTANRRFAVCWDSAGAIGGNKWLWNQDFSTVRFYMFDGVTLRNGVTGNVLTLNTWACVGVEYNGTGATDADKLVISINGVSVPVTPDGTLLSSLNAAITGDMFFGAISNSDTPSDPFVGDFGPNCFAFNAPMPGVTTGLLTPAARLALAQFEVPT